MSQIPSLTPARDTALALIETVNAQYPGLAERSDPEGIRLRTAVTISNAIALGIAELEDLNVDENGCEARMQSAIAGGIATLVMTLAQNDKAVGHHNLPFVIQEIYQRVTIQIEKGSVASAVHATPGNA